MREGHACKGGRGGVDTCWNKGQEVQWMTRVFGTVGPGSWHETKTVRSWLSAACLSQSSVAGVAGRGSNMV